ncbi:MAG: uncharacterized protein KVP18_002150 [Porospora cf. gigantea A]|uniref:uncharacterized protein n=1 Tax=Porospora cf. gigantea A TaxID=2853593 RepID=UPI00355ABE02|nr:MAG: hypothetical protein KVP18_002150 [Porospora cf. gigantea A]
MWKAGVSLLGTPFTDETLEDAQDLDQLDEQERRRRKDLNQKERFHGAFTGGFSAGFHNTVGSVEGWTPTTFSSTRQKRHQYKQQIEDIIDDEDKNEISLIKPLLLQTKPDSNDANPLSAMLRYEGDESSHLLAALTGKRGVDDLAFVVTAFNRQPRGLETALAHMRTAERARSPEPAAPTVPAAKKRRIGPEIPEGWAPRDEEEEVPLPAYVTEIPRFFGQLFRPKREFGSVGYQSKVVLPPTRLNKTTGIGVGVLNEDDEYSAYGMDQTDMPAFTTSEALLRLDEEGYRQVQRLEDKPPARKPACYFDGREPISGYSFVDRGDHRPALATASRLVPPRNWSLHHEPLPDEIQEASLLSTQFHVQFKRVEAMALAPNKSHVPLWDTETSKETILDSLFAGRQFVKAGEEAIGHGKEPTKPLQERLMLKVGKPLSSII